MSRIKLFAVDGTLAYSKPAISQEHIDAFSNTTTFAQAAARTVNRDPTTEPYFNTMSLEYQQLGWNVLEADKLDFRQSQGRISPAEVITGMLKSYLSREQRQQLEGLVAAIEQPDTRVRDFLSFWWSKGRVSANKQSLAIGPLFSRYGQPTFTLVYYTFNFSASSWRSLFVKRSAARLRVQARYLKQNLNMSLYRRIEDDLLARLAGRQSEHIESTELDI